jgi:DNA-binding PadR family transcriptional regulator
VILGYVQAYPDGVHGYQLGRMLSHSRLGLRSLRLGQLYRVLHHLESAGLVKSRVEAGGPRPARYRFTVTPEGSASFGEWLASPPLAGGPVAEQVLNRLRFAERLPGSALRRLLDGAVRACQTELDGLRREGDPSIETKPLHSMALEARVAAERRWLDELRQLVEELPGRSGTGAMALRASLRDVRRPPTPASVVAAPARLGSCLHVLAPQDF